MNIIKLEETTSTFDYFINKEDSLEEFTFVCASIQTNGRGREQNKWVSEKNKNLLFSFNIISEEYRNKFNYISLLVAKCIAEYLTNIGIEEVSIKWPNDVYVKNKKIAGILLKGDINKCILVGVGLNVNQKDFNIDSIVKPTSIINELGFKIELSLIMQDLFNFIELEIKNIDSYSIIEYINEHNFLLNKKINYYYSNELKEGIVKEVNKDGYLVVLSNDSEIVLNSGEVNTIREI